MAVLVRVTTYYKELAVAVILIIRSRHFQPGNIPGWGGFGVRRFFPPNNLLSAQTIQSSEISVKCITLGIGKHAKNADRLGYRYLYKFDQPFY